VDTRISLDPKPFKLKPILYTSVVVILVALAVDGIFGPHGFVATYRLRLQVQQAQRKAEQLTRENQQFASQVQQLKSNPSAIERVAREKMGLVKPGELVFKLQQKPGSGSNASPAAKAKAAAR
jgi:cell division protein FtsB